MEKIKTTSSQATVIGAQTRVKGSLEGDEDLHVVGRVDGNISLTKSLIVDPSGIVVADVQVAKAVVSGTVVGNITATDLVHITEQGRVVGDLRAPRVVLVNGASFCGNVDMGDMEAPRVAGPERVAPAMAPRPALVAKPAEKPAIAKPAPGLKPAPRPAPPPAPRPAPPPKRVVVAAPKAKPGAPRTLEKHAEAAAKAVAAMKREPAKKPDLPPAPVGKPVEDGNVAERSGTFSPLRPPRPPTTAGKKSKVRRK
jgi:cytoskeletal protein CcmA (bactofilin family)